ncbi:MAG TPA: hypothetical protein VFE31_00010 [Opitutaceae bacterium]|jgi:hypothetical protein|nr:hypothetical protein [Opitutaceae bacterium]
MTRAAFLVAFFLTIMGRPTLRAAPEQPWISATAAGCTIYSDSPVAEILPTAIYLNELFTAFHHLWPIPLSNAQPRPPVLIFVRSPEEFAELNPDLERLHEAVWAQERRLSGVPVLVCNPARQVSTHWRRRDPSSGREYDFSPVLYWRLQAFLTQQYCASVGERTPAWLTQGLRKLLNGACVMPNDVEIPALTTDGTLVTRSEDSDAPLAPLIRAGRFYTLPDLFANDGPQPSRLDWYVVNENRLVLEQRGWRRVIPLDGTHLPFWPTTYFGPFVDESYEFIHYCLFGDQGRFREALWRFGRAAANGPVDEADFTEQFGLSYAAMLERLWHYTGAGQGQVIRWNPADDPPAPVFRAAGPSEIESLLRQWHAAEQAKPSTRS